MATAVSDSYTATSGAVVYGGRQLSLPSWVPSVGTFANLGTSTLDSVKPAGWPGNDVGGPFSNWSGAQYAGDFSTFGAVVYHGSGHLAQGTPEWAGVWCFDLDDLTVKGRNVPSAPLLENLATDYNVYGESTVSGTIGHTTAPHTYDGLIYQSTANGGGLKGSLIRNSFAGSIFNVTVHQFDLSSATAPPTRRINSLGGNSYPQSATDEARGGYWYLNGNGNGPLKFIRFSDWSMTDYASAQFNDYGDYSLTYIPTLDCLVATGRTGAGGGSMAVYVSVISAGVPQPFVNVTISGTPPADARCGTCWSTILSKLVSYEASGSYVVHMLTPPAGSLTAGTWAWTQTTLAAVSGATPSKTTSVSNGTYGRFLEVPRARCFIWLDSVSQVPQAWRLPGM